MSWKHFSSPSGDCMAANWELALRIPIFWNAKAKLRNASQYVELEEALANAYMLRGFRYSARILADNQGALTALQVFCSDQPPGYRDGLTFAKSRVSYIAGCRDLSVKFQHASAQFPVPTPALDTLIFYPDVIRIDWRRCPIIVHDRFKILQTLGIGVSLFETISRIVETPKFLSELAKLDGRIERIWQRRKADLARSVQLKSLGFQRWERGGLGCYSVNVDGNYRVHIRHDNHFNSWAAENIGDHKSMGHG
jgi:hypothetical protein